MTAERSRSEAGIKLNKEANLSSRLLDRDVRPAWWQLKVERLYVLHCFVKKVFLHVGRGKSVLATL